MKSSGNNALKSIKPAWLLAALALLAAAWFAWAGVQDLGATRLQSQVDAARADAGTGVVNRLQAAVSQLEDRRGRLALSTALQREDMESAEGVIKGGWAEVEAVEWHDPGLDAPYADPKAFGYGKLGVLELALQDNTARAAVPESANL